ncbi:MAG: DUF5687 family protein [Flavobacteriaceae bacterium]
MIGKFVYLQWKSFFRAAGVTTKLLQKILIGFVWIYFAFVLTGVAIIISSYMQEELGLDPLATVSGLLIYGFVLWVVLRYLIQKMPVMHVQPLLALPIPRKKIVHFGLTKTIISFFNIINLFFFIPFGIILLKEGYSPSGLLGWLSSIGCLILTTNFLNIMLNSKDKILILTGAVLLSLFGLQYMGWFDVTTLSTPVFMAPYHQPLWALIPFALMLLTYYWSFHHFRAVLYLDSKAMRPKKEVQRATELKWLDGFGRTAFFLKNDIRLIVRNKRARMAVWMGFAFLFYGLIFMSDLYSGAIWQVFVGIFVSGGFLLSFGQFVPSWDSSYYPLMMTQNVAYKEYLMSKWWLVVVGTLISLPLASFYLFFSWETYLAILAGGMYNIGINAHMVLLSGAYTRTPIDLNSVQRAFGDKKSFNVKSLLLSIPKIFVPMFLFYVGVLIHSKMLGFVLIAVVGVLGFALRNLVFGWIERIYQQEKYLTINAYKQKNA